ncbi:arginase, hepatic isoform X2 [Bacillus rossius redtenbacheri]|uniref:arginase, hepatic isoform X2 n=1 Tax=Bacillus rossius redtenbacheri TaxID=93214 RepID=UPI002FDE15C2
MEPMQSGTQDFWQDFNGQVNTSKRCEVKDYGNVVWPEVQPLQHKFNINNLEHVAACHKEVSRRARAVLHESDVCVALGGDHSLSLGSVDGHAAARGELALLWVDAHADANTPDTSPSGSAHGMPVSLLARELAACWAPVPPLGWLATRLPAKNIAYIGLRSVDEYERILLEKFNITAFTMEDVERLGIASVTAMALQMIDPKLELPLHVSFDIDSLDPLEAPSTGTPVRGGLTLREGLHVMDEAFRTGRLSAVDLVEVNPKIGDQRDVTNTIEAAIKILEAACGHSRRGNYPQ